MHTPKNTWDMERAAAWLRKHTWGAKGEEGVPALAHLPPAMAAAAQAQAALVPECATDGEPQDEHEDIDIAGWPALVAPFYD